VFIEPWSPLDFGVFCWLAVGSHSASIDPAPMRIRLIGVSRISDLSVISHANSSDPDGYDDSE